MKEGLELSGPRVVTGQSMVVATNPKKSRSVSDDRSRKRTDSLVEGVLSRFAVDAVERVNLANPQGSVVILIDAVYHRAAQAVRVGGLVLEFFKERRSSGKPVRRHHV